MIERLTYLVAAALCSVPLSAAGPATQAAEPPPSLAERLGDFVSRIPVTPSGVVGRWRVVAPLARQEIDMPRDPRPKRNPPTAQAQGPDN